MTTSCPVLVQYCEGHVPGQHVWWLEEHAPETDAVCRLCGATAHFAPQDKLDPFNTKSAKGYEAALKVRGLTRGRKRNERKREP